MTPSSRSRDSGHAVDSPEPLLAAPPLREQVHARLREAIITGELAAGTRLSPARIARSFGISTMPVREALGFLLEEGLIETAPRRWTRVASPNAEVGEETYPLVALLEEYALVSSKPFARRTITELRSTNEKLETAANRADVIACVQIDESFHRGLILQARNATLERVLSELKARIRLLEGTYFRLDHAEDSVQEHASIIDALEQGERDEAGRLVRAHWLRGHQRVREVI